MSGGRCERLLAGTALRPLVALISVSLANAFGPGVGLAMAAAGGGSSAVAGGGEAASTVEFDSSLLSGYSKSAVDLAAFERGDVIMPGIYSLDLYLADNWVGRADVRFSRRAGQPGAAPCMTRRLLAQLGLTVPGSDPEIGQRLDDPGACVDIGQVFRGASVQVDMAELRLVASVPQIFLGHSARGYVSPQFWDSGVPSAVLNYNLNVYHTQSPAMAQTMAYLGLNSGINIGRWHLRQDASLNWVSGSAQARSQLQWQDIDIYVRRDVPAWRAQLTLGDSYTDGQVFDSFGVRGVQLATDDRMLPDSMRGYAPVIRGIAHSNARVVVRQNGIQIYQATVSPGPFAITDLYPTGYGGSLEVAVTEADGSTSTFSVPYASLVQLMRPGITRFSLVAGQLRNLALRQRPGVLQGTLQHGFLRPLTGYTGVLAAQGYAALLLGVALDTRVGAVALDLTRASTRIQHYGRFSGQSVRISYSKTVTRTDTTFSVAAYRYSTSGYFSLADAALARDDARRGLAVPIDAQAGNWLPGQVGMPGSNLPGLTPPQALDDHLGGTSVLSGAGVQRARGSFTLSMSQPFGRAGGSMYANVSASSYWGRRSTDTQFQVGYNNHIGRLSYSLSASRSRDLSARTDDEFMLSFSLPLGNASHAPNLQWNLSHTANGQAQEQAMLNGVLGADNQFNYGVTASHDGQGSSGMVNGGYRSPYGLANMSYGQGPGYAQSSLGLSGAIVVHPGGITFGQPSGDTLAIVHAPGAAGADVLNAAGTRIDRGGYALVPYLTPYNLNTIQLDPRGLPLNVELQSTSAQVAPRAGAVVMIQFKTRGGRTLLLQVRDSRGAYVPFGTEVSNARHEVLGVIGQQGLVFLRGVAMAGRVYAHWNTGVGGTMHCMMDYGVSGPKASLKRMVVQPAICRPLAAASRAVP